jgi:spermidine synthase
MAANIEYLAAEESRLGMICLRRRELLSRPGVIVTEITLDHQFLMSSHNTASERALSQRAIAMHGGAGLAVLVGGLGLGYTARELLRSAAVSRVDVVEYLPEVIGWLDRGLLPLAAELGADPRLAVVEADVYDRLSRPPERHYDLILVDVDHSPEERLGDTNESFYTEEGLGLARRHLAPGGILGVWSYAESPAFERRLRAVFREVRAEPVRFRNVLFDEEETNWLFFGRDG